jgi:hypothetical protein
VTYYAAGIHDDDLKAPIVYPWALPPAKNAVPAWS